MATFTKESGQLLDQLQNEVGSVVVSMGKLIKAINENPDVAPTVQTQNLKQVVRPATDNFHEALDQLENELQLAKLVMRRDLAVSREKSGLAKAAPAKGTEVSTAQPAKEPTPDMKPEPDAEATKDTAMEDVQPSGEAEMTDAPAAEPAPAPEPEPKTDESEKADQKVDSESKSTDQPDSTNDAKPPSPESKDPDTTLQITTQPPSNPAESDPAPDTATFTNPDDFDSLFGGPTSAEGTNLPTQDFDFSFDVNPADDNITSLLPGLQDYANTADGDNAAGDFGDVFNFDDMDMGDGGAGQGDGEGLFDFGEFGAGEFGDEGQGNGNGEGGQRDGEIDFSFD